MSGPRERMETLRRFGLSEYAARAYLALLDLGTTEARDVSRLSNVPLAKVYSTLEHLQEKGLVLVSPETPKKYTPVPFAEFVDRLTAAHERQARELRTAREELAAEFPITGAVEMDDRGGVTTVRGRRNALDRMRDLAAEARHEMVLVASAGTLLRFAHLRAMLEDARARGLRVRVVAPLLPATKARFDELCRACELRVRPDEPGQAMQVAFLCVDRRVALLVHHVPDDGGTTNGKDVGILADETALVQTLHSFAEYVWERAAPWEPVGEPA